MEPSLKTLGACLKALDWLFGKLRPNQVRRFLVIEDNADDATILLYLLKQAGHSSELAATAELAEGMIRAFKYHAVFLDVRFGGMDGMELLRRLERNCPNIIVVLTPGEASDLKELPHGRCTLVIVKPVTSEAISHFLKTTRF